MFYPCRQSHRINFPSLVTLVRVAVIAILSFGGLISCSTKRNTAASRNYQAFITRYNVYFNGDQHFKETLKEMENSYEDDYTSLLLMHPVEAYAVDGAPKPTGSFTRSIEKAQKAIQLHSIRRPPRRKPGHTKDVEYQKWMKRGEYNPFIHNAWLLLGRSQYFNGDFLGASSTFRYIAKHFDWLPSTVTDSRLWEARCYCAMDWLFEAEMILTRIKVDALDSDALRELYYFTYSDFYIRSGEYAKAIPMLRETIKFAGGAQKVRLNFLLGQLCALQGDNSAAYEAYRKAASGNAASYRAKFTARIKQSEVFLGDNITPEVNALKRMTRYGRNSDYLDQIYYAIGNLYLSRRDTLNAIANYRMAADNSTRGGIEKGISQLALGKLFYDTRRYDLAQPCYADAAALLPSTYPGYDEVRSRSDILDELALYTRNVTLNDSLLRLAEMPEADRLRVVDSIIAELKKREKEETERIAREDYMAEQSAISISLQPTSAATPNNFMLNTDNSWYFYNPATRNAGRADFQRRWGARKLEDDWRRHDKNRFSFDDFAEAQSDGQYDDDSGDDGLTGDAELTGERSSALASDPHNREYYLRQIPSTDIEKNSAREIIQDGMYTSGLILKDRIDDYGAAETIWEDLLSRYPHNVYRLDIYYNEYLMNMRLWRYAEAERWRQKILSDFPDTKYGISMRDPDYIANMRSMESLQDSLYEQAYDDYISNRNESLHSIYDRMREEYPMSPLMPKFMFLNALAYVTENRPDEFRSSLRELLEKYPDTELTPMVSSYLHGMAQGRKLNSDGANPLGMIWATPLSSDSTAIGGDEPELDFTFGVDEPHYLVLLFPAEDVSANQLLYEVARHNFNSYQVRDFDLEMMSFGRLGVLVIKGFANRKEVDRYRPRLEKSGILSRLGDIRPVPISEHDFRQLIINGASIDTYFRSIPSEPGNNDYPSLNQ